MLRFLSPLLGLSIFALASGYLMTLIPLRINALHGSDLLAGYMGSIYYIGLLAGSFRSEHLVTLFGHIRSFAAFMALLCASVLSLAIFDSTASWLLLRFLNGLAIAGVFIVVESWLLCESDEKTRGKILSFYMVALYGANAIGQLFVGLIDSLSLMPFIVIGTLLSLSILPPAMSRIPTPELESVSSLNFIKLFKLTPSAIIGCLTGGMILGALYSLLPIHLLEESGSEQSVSIQLSITMLGGMLLQYPVGCYSDKIDRRKVLVAISTLGCICCLLYIWFDHDSWINMILLFLIGGTTFTLYPLAISHGCDHLQPEDIVAGTQGLLLAYSTGACIGPVLAASFIKFSGSGLMLYFAVILAIVALFFLMRIPFRPVIYSSDEQSFVPVPRTTPLVAQIDPRSETEESD